MPRRCMACIAAVTALACAAAAGLSAAGQGRGGPPRGPAREITQVTGDLYRARNGLWATAFLVTKDGIVLGDPINPDFAAWLKGQLDERFHVPVRYVVYSHSHFDHAPGGAVFAGTARFVAHENMARNMDGRYPQMPGDMIDRNSNGRIDQDDIMIPTNAAPGICGWGASFFTTWDRNKDGQVTPAELFADVPPPDIVYSDRMRLTLGGKVVELVHPGLNHADDMTVMYFPAERAVFAVDFLADALVTRRCIRCRARADRSTVARCRNGSSRTVPSSHSTSTCWSPATARCSGSRT